MKSQSKKSLKVSPTLSRGQNNLSDVRGMLADFRSCMLKGYSHENWTLATRIYHALSSTLFSPEREVLGSTIRELYVAGSVNPEYVDAQLARVESAL